MPQSAEKSLEQIRDLLAASTDLERDASVVIDFAHQEVHEGETWFTSYKSPEGADIADNGTIEILIKVSAAMFAHAVFGVAAGGDAEIEFFEDPVVVADGNLLPIWNMKRGTVSVPGTAVYQGPTLGGNGDRLINSFAPGGTKQQAHGAVERAGTEWILNKDTNYLLVFTNRAGSAKPMSIVFQWYDHEL